MRHVIGVILAGIMTAILFFAGSWGYLRLLRLPPADGSLTGLPAGGGSLLSNHSVLYSFAALIITGLLAGVLIAVPRISPLGSGLPGLGLLAWTALYLTNVHRAVSLIPMRSRDYGAGFEALGVNGILAAVGLAMIIPLFMPSRWRTTSYAGYDPGYAPPPPQLGTGLVGDDWSQTAPQSPLGM